MRLFREVLDSQMVDRDGRQAGKVDGIVAELRDDGPPVITALENGFPTLFRRVSPRLGDWVAALGRRYGVRHGEAYRIPRSRVRGVGIDVKVDLDATETPLFAWEHWLREHVVDRIPGSGS
ncbi:MAG TPA: hypothetical protein VFL93_04005 [Longimicrobiaceae bacterium]|nr:hypothetical protein [Longimicrobiaceae bacterium]